MPAGMKSFSTGNFMQAEHDCAVSLDQFPLLVLPAKVRHNTGKRRPEREVCKCMAYIGDANSNLYAGWMESG